jgi:hypothetical protein
MRKPNLMNYMGLVEGLNLERINRMPEILKGIVCCLDIREYTEEEEDA